MVVKHGYKFNSYFCPALVPSNFSYLKKILCFSIHSPSLGRLLLISWLSLLVDKQVAIVVAVPEETGKEPTMTTDDSRGETGWSSSSPMSFSAAIAGLPPPMLFGLSSLQLLSPQAAEPEE